MGTRLRVRARVGTRAIFLFPLPPLCRFSSLFERFPSCTRSTRRFGSERRGALACSLAWTDALRTGGTPLARSFRLAESVPRTPESVPFRHRVLLLVLSALSYRAFVSPTPYFSLVLPSALHLSFFSPLGCGRASGATRSVSRVTTGPQVPLGLEQGKTTPKTIDGNAAEDR